jgi:pimeloyl-ACP methyl ester carboxylesterase
VVNILSNFVSLPDSDAELIPVTGYGGVRLNLYRLRRSRGSGPAVLFGHACGFAAGSYLPLFERLLGDAEIFAFDARGHGGSDAPAPAPGLYDPDSYARDLLALGTTVAARIKGRPLHYVGHSLCAAAMLRLGACLPALFRTVPWRSVLIFEPPIFPSAGRPEHAECLEKDRRLAQRTAARRSTFASPDELVALIAGRGVFRDVQREFLLAHAQATLRPIEGGGYTLACPPGVEAATFASFGEDSTFCALPGFPAELPLRYVAGDAEATERNWATLAAPAAAVRLGLGQNGPRRFTQLPGRGHLMIQEDPEMTCELIRGMFPTP